MVSFVCPLAGPQPAAKTLKNNLACTSAAAAV
jgi:hypothetical protein